MEKTRLAIVEDNHTLRQRLVEHLKFYEGLDVVLAVGSGEALMDILKDRSLGQMPEVILMDIELPGISGIEATARVKALHPGIDILMHTVFEDTERLFESVRVGASGYLLKDEPTDKVVEAVEQLKGGGAPMSPTMARKMLGFIRLQSATPTREESFDLSDRELDILQLLVDGLNYKEIGDKLFISPQTVRSHIKNIYKKMHVHSRAEAVRVALKKRLTD
jgi:DNA-binding NarL/FixJ family response regulator